MAPRLGEPIRWEQRGLHYFRVNLPWVETA